MMYMTMQVQDSRLQEEGCRGARSQMKDLSRQEQEQTPILRANNEIASTLDAGGQEAQRSLTVCNKVSSL